MQSLSASDKIEKKKSYDIKLYLFIRWQFVKFKHLKYVIIV